MNVINKFKNFFTKKVVSTVVLVTEHGNGFYRWNGNIYKSDIVCACIRPFYKAVGKMQAQHIRSNGKDIVVNPEAYIKFLLEEPNPLMTGQKLLEKMAVQYKLNNNAFACILRDEFGFATEIYPLPATGAEALYSEKNELWLKFVLKNGKVVKFPYTDIIHLRQDFNENDVFGDSPVQALEPLMEIVTTTDQGIVKAIKNSSVIRWLLKVKQMMTNDDLTKYVANFNKNFLSVENSGAGGAAAVDSKADVEQVDPKDYVPNSSQMEKTTQRIYNFFGVNQKIIQRNYTEDEWNAYYEGEIEPFAIEFGEELTRKIFSRRERSCGNKIILSGTLLACASMATRLNLVQMVDRGSMTPNEWRITLNLGPIEGGDKPIRRLDTAVVNNKGNKDNG